MIMNRTLLPPKFLGSRWVLRGRAFDKYFWCREGVFGSSQYFGVKTHFGDQLNDITYHFGALEIYFGFN